MTENIPKNKKNGEEKGNSDKFKFGVPLNESPEEKPFAFGSEKEEPQEEVIDLVDEATPEEVAAEKEESAEIPEEDIIPIKDGEKKVPEEIVNLADLAPEPQEGKGENTREEDKGVLRSLVDKLAAHAKSEFEATGLRERFGRYFDGRNVELDTEAKKLGPRAFELINSVVDRYNKLSLWKKLAISGGLVAGVSLTSTAAPIISGILATAMYGQRALGAAGLMKKQREKLDQYTWSKDKKNWQKNTLSVALAAGWMGGSIFAVHEGVEALNALGVNEWLGNMLGHHQSSVHNISARVHIEHPASAPAHEAPAAAAVPAAAGEHAAAAAAHITSPEMPAVSVDAVHGHGYEYMTKRLWEQLKDKHLNPSDYDANSDIHKLLTADANSIDKVVHQIAQDPQHGFFNADGTSIRIDPSAHMHIGADGQISLSDATHADITHAAPDMHAVPSHHTEAHAAPHSAEASAVPHEAAPVPHETAPVEAHLESMAPTDQAMFSGADAHVAADTSHLGHIAREAVTNQFGLSVYVNEPHIYADTGGKLLAFGGTPEARIQAVSEYLTRHPGATVLNGTDDGLYRVPWYMNAINNRPTPGEPLRAGGFLGFFKSFVQEPNISELNKLVQ